MRLVRENDTSEQLDLLLPQRSLYILRFDISPVTAGEVSGFILIFRSQLKYVIIKVFVVGKMF